MISITNSSELREVIEIAKLNNEDYHEAIYAIHKYKWANWYLNIHVKMDTPADAENTLIFESLKNDYPKIHEDVEFNISMEVERLKTGPIF